MRELMNAEFREKLGVGAGLYDSVYAGIGDLRSVLPKPWVDLTAEEADVLRHNIAVWAALHGNLWLKSIFEDLKRQV